MGATHLIPICGVVMRLMWALCLASEPNGANSVTTKRQRQLEPSRSSLFVARHLEGMGSRRASRGLSPAVSREPTFCRKRSCDICVVVFLRGRKGKEAEGGRKGAGSILTRHRVINLGIVLEASMAGKQDLFFAVLACS
ncbi:uncharacterized protein B0H64DRAFT_249383 [Chaetomium fimeti]|uniref:Secreted protein n=1 Tax=Chaetomium fimeti TaxID=1854472 RepID=A0AAE0LP04_9PEZI|nr:hypothetical protein B0H64DRAFT_249383 [Chaetomium fimeti]